MQKLAVVIPTLHEAENIRPLVGRLQCALEPLKINYELIIVDDDSQDGIGSVVAEISAADPRIRLLTRIGKRGLAGAILHGWANTDANVLGAIDADLQHPPEIVPALWREIVSGAEVVVASRYTNGSILKWNRFRHLISRVAIWSTLPLQRRKIRTKDPMSGFFLLQRSCIDNLILKPQGFKLLLEIVVRGKIRSLSEVPFAFGHRRYGASKATLKVAVDFISLLFRLYVLQYTSRSISADRDTIIAKPTQDFPFDGTHAATSQRGFANSNVAASASFPLKSPLKQADQIQYGEERAASIFGGRVS